jgi:hypothetical protein
MSFRICDIPVAAEEKLAPALNDRSGIGVHYVDAWIKPLNLTMPDGTKVVCKRRGLKVTLTVGDRKGEGLMRRLEHGPDPRLMLVALWSEVANNGGPKLSVVDGGVWVE